MFYTIIHIVVSLHLSLSLSALLHSPTSPVIRQMLVRENLFLDAQDMLVLRGAKKERVEEYARCKSSPVVIALTFNF